MMNNKKELIRLKYEIEKKREKLNEIVLNKIDKNKILQFSQELDILIAEYISYTVKMAE